MTRNEQLAIVWKATPVDYRSIVNGQRSILVLREGGTHLVPLSDLTDAEIAGRAKLFTAAQLEALRAEYSKIRRVDPSQPTYGKIAALLSGMSQAQLKQLRDARIPWLGRLAINRIRED